MFNIKRDLNMNNSFYDENYFQHGIETGKSNYQNYRWVPELTIPMAMTTIDYLGIKKGQSVLDFGCALGYLVKALRLLHREAWGVDISEYALSNLDKAVENFCFHVSDLYVMPKNKYDFCIAKDVFEHLQKSSLEETLASIIKARILFVVVPLGKEGVFTAPANRIDKSHVICEELKWWEGSFLKTGWQLQRKSCYKIEGIKDAYYKEYPKAHGFFTLKRK
jgi:SAM-dependent methyltransferase